jgi:predicted ATPase
MRAVAVVVAPLRGRLRRHLQETLYDRSREQVLLQSAFQRAFQRGLSPLQEQNSTFLLITGPSGTGKTRLARTLRGQVHDRGGYFLTGKFEQSCRPEPYTAFVEALTEFTCLVNKRGDAAVAMPHWRQ